MCVSRMPLIKLHEAKPVDISDISQPFYLLNPGGEEEQGRDSFTVVLSAASIRLSRGHLRRIPFLARRHQTAVKLHTPVCLSSPSRQRFVFMTRNTQRNILNRGGGE